MKDFVTLLCYTDGKSVFLCVANLRQNVLGSNWFDEIQVTGMMASAKSFRFVFEVGFISAENFISRT